MPKHTAQLKQTASPERVERFRPEPDPQPQEQQPKAKRTPKKQRVDNSSILFLPNNIWDHCPVLPLAHRGDDDDTKFTLREFAGFIACLVTGRRKLAAMQKAEAWEAGKLGMHIARS